MLTKLLFCAMVISGTVTLYQQLPVRIPRAAQADFVGQSACGQLSHFDLSSYARIPYAIDAARAVSSLIGC
jgi:hypothetical protein